MVLRNAVVEQNIKPVCISVFSLAQISISCFRSVRQSKSCVCVVTVDQMIHLTIYTTVRSTVYIREVQVTVAFQCLIYVHLFLRVHDVEVTVVRFQTHGEFTCIADLVRTCLTFLGSNDNHTCHGTSTIDRSSRTILQDLEAFDIVSIQTRDSRTDQCNGITRRQIVSTYFRYILHDDTIYYPQRFRATVDRCGTTYTDFRSCTEST